MTVVDHKAAFEHALHLDDADFLLTTLLGLVVAVEQTLRWHIDQLQAIESASNAELYHDTVGRLMTLDMLGYVSGASDQEASELRNLLDSETPTRIIAWYQHQWSGRVTKATDIIESVASALRTALTLIYGNVYLLREYTEPNAEQEAVYQQIIAAVDTLRVCRNQLRNRLGPKGVDIRLF
jgi:hypothetical protein